MANDQIPYHASNYKPCQIKRLPEGQWVPAAAKAIEINPLNAPAIHQMKMAMPSDFLHPLRLAISTTRYWGIKGVDLTVGFLDSPSSDLRNRILFHMNSWGLYANVKFRESADNPKVRISRVPGDGYWSYLGTDILLEESYAPTMNFDSFTMETSDSEYYRVIRHETGHTLGFPHEHMRQEIVNRINREKVFEYFKTRYGWSELDVVRQVLTGLNAEEIIATEKAFENSIMCYSLPGEIMNDGKDVIGGHDITIDDANFAATIYPKAGPLAKAVKKEDEIKADVKLTISYQTGKPAEDIDDSDSLKADLHLTTLEIRAMATPFQFIARKYKPDAIILPEECEEQSTVSDFVNLVISKT